MAQLCRAGWSQPEAGNDWALPWKSHLFHAALPCQQHFNKEADLSHAEHPKLSLPQAQTAAALCFPNPQLQLQNPCSADHSRGFYHLDVLQHLCTQHWRSISVFFRTIFTAFHPFLLFYHLLQLNPLHSSSFKQNKRFCKHRYSSTLKMWKN